MTAPFALLELSYDGSQDSSSLRSIAGRAARLLGLPDVDCTRVSTAVSEVARLIPDSTPVRVRLGVVSQATPPRSTLSVDFAFAGVPEVMTLAVQAAASRLMDDVRVGADHIVLTRTFAGQVPASQRQAVRDRLLRDSGTDHGALLQSLNEELVAALVELREREADLVQVNAELDQTNRGVVALYAELEQRSAEVRAAQRVVFEELEAALRPPPPEVPGLELAVRYLPAEANSPTGGDLYDWFVLPDGGIVHVTVVDVRGHGVTGTRDALRVTHTVRTLALEGHPLGEVLARADAILQATAGEVVATVVLAQLDPSTGRLQIAGAGHPPALHLPAAGAPDYLEARGRPLGYEGGGSREVAVSTLAPGDTVLLYTDGLIEIRRDVLEGMDRLVRAAGDSRHLPLPSLLASTVALCADGEDLTDDTLVLGLRLPPAPS